MEIISSVQKEILNIFGNISDNEHFYLTGGTALSCFYLKHRKSNDLDFFTTYEEILLSFSYKLEEALEKQKMDIQRQRAVHSFIEFLIKKGTESTVVHMACDASFRLAETKEFPEYPGLKIDSLIDIAANKLLALFGRASLRDFIDVYFLVKKAEFTPEELINKAKMKDPGFDLYWLGVALERINTFKYNSQEMLLLIEPIDFNEMSVFFNQWRKKVGKELI